MDRTTFEKKLDLYLDGKLPDKEIQEFETYISENSQAQDELKFYQKVKGSVIRHGRNVKLEKLSMLQGEIKNTKREIQKKRKRLLVYGSAAIILIFITALFVLPQIFTSEELLLSGQFEIEGLSSEAVLGADNTKESTLVNFFKSSKNNGFRESDNHIDFFLDKSDISEDLRIVRDITNNEFLLIMNSDSIILREIDE